MKKQLCLILVLMAVLFSSCKEENKNLADGLYAEIETNKGTIIVALEYTKVPITVANFVSLAEGKNPFVLDNFKGKPFFDGLKFHRVIPNFMIQTGDPLGNGSGDGGYKFKDEITDLRHDKPGILSMANSGPGTNSSQFFITHLETPWLDGKHTVFGHVVENGMAVVNTITQDDYINSVTIIRKGEAVKKFDAVKIFSDFFKFEAENQKKQAILDAESKKVYDAKYKVVKDQKVLYHDEILASTIKTTSGLRYKIIQKGSGKKPAKGATVFMNYAGFLKDGTLFDSNMVDVAKAFGKFDKNRALQNGYTPSPYQMGSNELIPGFIEGLEKMSFGDKAILYIPSEIGFGEQGAGNVIPPNAVTIFEIELLEKNTK
jgi:cyclophilin family peptidyl-prolyl cis-trans isomerase